MTGTNDGDGGANDVAIGVAVGVAVAAVDDVDVRCMNAAV